MYDLIVLLLEIYRNRATQYLMFMKKNDLSSIVGKLVPNIFV